MKNRKYELKRNLLLFLCLLLILILSITACKNENKNKTETKESDFWIYYINYEETQVVREAYIPKHVETLDLIQEFLNQLDKNPKDLTYKKAKPDFVALKGYELKEDGQLTLDFDGNYNDLEGITEILCRTAIVKTLSQIEGVDYIEFYVNGHPLMDTNEKPISFMKGSDFIDNTGGHINYNQDVTMTLFFANKKGNALVETRIKKIYDGTVPMEQLIIEQLIKGPSVIKGAENDSLYPTLPGDTKFLKVTTKDGVCYIDMNEIFLEKLPDITNEVAIYSVVNSLAELPTIDKVKFLINGEEQKTYKETIPFDGYFERNLDIIQTKE